MADINPPYRFDPLQNPVNVKWMSDGEPDEEAAHPMGCWNHWVKHLIFSDLDGTRWPLCQSPPAPQYTPNPSESVANCAGGGDWYVDGDVIYVSDWIFACGTPNAADIAQKPTEPPPSWPGFNAEQYGSV